MGLDVSAYKKLSPATDAEAFDADGELKWEGDADLFVQPYINKHYPERAADIKHRQAYRYGESESFWSGAYSRYNRWREQLAELAGYQETEAERYGQAIKSFAETVWRNPIPGPFMELINFSDCEGVIGTTVSKKLAKDFADFQEKADAHECDHFKAKYKEWREAFEFASDAGLVEFH